MPVRTPGVVAGPGGATFAGCRRIGAAGAFGRRRGRPMSEPAERRRRWRPPTLPIPSGLDRLDLAVDDWFEAHLRGRPAVDRLMYTASAVGDHGLVWLALAALQAIRQPPPVATTISPDRHRVWGSSRPSSTGRSSGCFDRTRPVHEGPRPLHLRSP